MTFQRVLKRNGLAGTDYGTTVSGFNTKVYEQITADQFAPGIDMEQLLRRTLRDACEAITNANSRWSTLCGDMKRMQDDMLDEHAICAHIAERSGIDPEIVAAVLKEFAAF